MASKSTVNRQKSANTVISAGETHKARVGLRGLLTLKDQIEIIGKTNLWFTLLTVKEERCFR